MTNSNPTTETVNTLELRTGDIVRTHGMRVRLGERGSRVTADDIVVVWFYGTVLNPDEVDPAIVPVSFRTSDRHPEFAPGTFWQIQGNHLARWAREV